MAVPECELRSTNGFDQCLASLKLRLAVLRGGHTEDPLPRIPVRERRRFEGVFGSLIEEIPPALQWPKAQTSKSGIGHPARIAERRET